MAKAKRVIEVSLSIRHDGWNYAVRTHAIGDGHLVLVYGRGRTLCCGWRAGNAVDMPPRFRGSWPRGLKRVVVDELKRMEGSDA